MPTMQPYALSSKGISIRLTESLCTLDDGGEISYTTYGIELVNEDGNVMLAYKDISTKREFVEAFICKCTDNDVYAEHVPDLLEDCLE